MNTTHCYELSLSPVSEGAVAEIPLKNGKVYTVFRGQLAKWEKAFPLIDVEATLRKIEVWNESNPSRRKTETGVLRHITSWLSRENDKPQPIHSGDHMQNNCFL